MPPKKTIEKKHTKPQITVLYNLDLTKKQLINEAKTEVRDILNDLKKNMSNEKQEKFTEILDKLDKKSEYFRLLFIYSLYCSFYHKFKNKIDVQKLNFPLEECYKKYNFVILDLNESHHQILRDLTIFFNTDATHIEPITTKILSDLDTLDIQFTPMQFI